LAVEEGGAQNTWARNSRMAKSQTPGRAEGKIIVSQAITDPWWTSLETARELEGVLLNRLSGVGAPRKSHDWAAGIHPGRDDEPRKMPVVLKQHQVLSTDEIELGINKNEARSLMSLVTG